MFLIKLGGSVITEKAKEARFRQDVMDSLSTQIAMADQQVIIVHGAGSFGHGYAKQFQLHHGFTSEDQTFGFALTQRMVQQLNTQVLVSLQDHHLPAVSIPPHIATMFQNGGLFWFQHDVFKTYLDFGFIPVTYGDVAPDLKRRFFICSGDLLILALAEHFKPEKVIFVLDEDGLYTGNPKIDKQAAFIPEISAKKLSDLETTLDDHPDVTKGMKGKLQTIQKIAALQIDTVLVNGNKPDRLKKVLTGNHTIQTRVHWRNADESN